MASLQIRDVAPELINRLKALAKQERRTLSNQVLFVLEQYIESKQPKRRDLATAAKRLEHFWSAEGAPAAEIDLADRSADAERDRRLDGILQGKS